MIKLNPVELLVTLAIFSAYIKDERPVSILLVSKVESGKSKLLGKFSGNRGCEMVGDATAWGIAKHYGKRIRNGDIRHILFPEMSIPLSRRYDTVSALDAYLCGLIEEGVGKIVSFRYGEVSTVTPTGCGIIACLSNQDFSHKKAAWFRIGLMSRLIPVSFDYTDVTKNQIRYYIKTRNYRNEDKIELKLPSSQIDIQLPLPIADQLAIIAGQLIVGTELYGFRWQNHLQRLAMANALLNGRNVVEDTDLATIRALSGYFNTDCKKKI